MKIAAPPKNERRRLESLRRTELLDTPATPEFDDLTRLAAIICGTPIALVSLVDEHRQWFKSRVGLGAQETPRDVAFCAHAIHDDELFVVPDAHADVRFHDNPLVTGGPHVRFYAGAPLLNGDGDALGTLCVIDRVAREITPEQRVALEALARQVMTQIKLHERTTELVRYGSEMTLLNELGELLQSCRAMSETSEVIGAYVHRLFAGTSGQVALTNSSRNLVEPLASWGDQRPATTFGPDDCWALRRGRAHLVPATSSGVRCPHRATTEHGYVCIPMMAQGETLGILHLEAGSEPLSETRLRLATTTAERVALALANTQLREKLRSQSIRDALTGLYNRRYLEESLPREVERCRLQSRPLAVLAIDVDHFKRFNDDFGHAAGDAVLQSLGALLLDNVRREDLVCRYGGEEIFVVMPDAPHDTAVARAQQIVDAVRRMQVSRRSHGLGRISVSIGVASLPRHGVTPDELMHAADAALYRAKEAGRDRVVEAACEPANDTVVDLAS